ncbi:MAG: DUF2264 domain-containing protein [Kiritimatiellae bacterium]|jgi:hypothetical protein|nr:DUF2264 domain-containing protein [Kiritimatiellia bacterium]
MPLDFDSLTENPELSPYTGWTREHWLHLSKTLIGGYLNTLNEETFMPIIGALIPTTTHLEDPNIYGMGEFFERHLIMATAWLKGTGITKADGWKYDLAESYQNAIIIGTTSGSKYEWKDLPPNSAFGNGLAMAIMIAPEYFWDPFTPEQKMNIGFFMKRLAEHSSHENNHWYFHLAGVPIMDLCGIEYDAEYFADKWKRLIEWYKGDGWYIDGTNKSYDYYNHWGFHYFNLLLYCGCKKWQKLYGYHIKEATTSFLKTYPLFFSSDASSVPWGRSLTYRHALLAPLTWAQYADISPLSPGLSRRIASGNLKYFFQNDNSSIISQDDLLLPGYIDYSPNLLETYNDQGSACWSSTAFIALALPENHPFWSDTEEPLPADKNQNIICRIDGPKFLIQQNEGHARLFCFEQPRTSPAWQLSIKYGQQVFDGALGFGLIGEKGNDPGFNRVGYRFENYKWCYRSSFICEELTENYGISSWAIFENAIAGNQEIGRIYQCTIPGEDMDIHIIYHTCHTPLYLSFGGLCISTHGEFCEFKCFDMEDQQMGLKTSQNFSAIAQLSSIPGQFKNKVIKPEQTTYSSHIFGGTGVFPDWKSNSSIEANQVLMFASQAGKCSSDAFITHLTRVSEIATLLKKSDFKNFYGAIKNYNL